MLESNKPISKNLVETILVVLLFLGLLYALFQVLEVFSGVLTFALVFAVSFSYPYGKLVGLFCGRRKLAGVVYSVSLIAVIALPFIFLVSALSRHVRDLAGWIGAVQKQGLPPLSDKLTNLPLVGGSIASFWAELQQSPKEVLHIHGHELNVILHHLVTGGLGIIGVAAQLILGIIISAYLLERGDQVLFPVRDTLNNLLSRQEGGDLLQAITQAVRGVSIGVMGTAFIATFVCWTGLLFAGIPFAVGLSALIFFLCVIQVGPLIIWIPLAGWEYLQGHNNAVIILAIYTVIILVIDFVVKPVMIARSGKLPFLVLFLGVIGGLSAWGFTGMFKGAIITSVFYTIFNAWLERKKANRLTEGP
ncbi:AI-2E family transporter [Mucilaginibacter sp. BJC16-A38]|uniref:AI-2E family transporter n=1 Tax=Mucilaginibacter phenanthrenivorans TaxID=1234842 RepID=UPI002157E75B|nr:AI-2E family transporter [Mucilaginibacter phenanthrenivorans]MCR8560378.1 AI-2E family transporter [Mucilaginibacter phenanthrenivorans]